MTLFQAIFTIIGIFASSWIVGNIANTLFNNWLARKYPGQPKPPVHTASVTPTDIYMPPSQVATAAFEMAKLILSDPDAKHEPLIKFGIKTYDERSKSDDRVYTSDMARGWQLIMIRPREDYHSWRVVSPKGLEQNVPIQYKRFIDELFYVCEQREITKEHCGLRESQANFVDDAKKIIPPKKSPFKLILSKK